MARPQGHRLSRKAWDDALRFSGHTLTEIAVLADVSRPTLSGLLGGFHRASVPMARRISIAVGVHQETLFPTLDPSFAEAA